MLAATAIISVLAACGAMMAVLITDSGYSKATLLPVHPGECR